MALYAGSLFWPGTLPATPAYPSLEADLDCEVLVAGGGVSGALCAHYLVEAGLDVVLVERDRVAMGSSAVNTGILQYSNDTMLCEFLGRMPREDAVAIYRLCSEGLDELERISRDLIDPTDFLRRDSIYFASSREDVGKLLCEYSALSEHGFPVECLDHARLMDRYGIDKPAALVTRGDAEVNPSKLIHALIRHTAQSSRVFELTGVRSLESGQTGVRVLTTGGSIRAKQVIFATGYARENLPRLPGARLGLTYSAVSRPIPTDMLWPDGCMIWETARSYLYLRTTPDHRVIIGGLDEPRPEPGNDPAFLTAKGEVLLQELKRLFPRIETEPEYLWAATFGDAQDGIPYFGVDPADPRVFYCLGYGGNGTVCSVVGARIIRDLLLKGHHPQAHIFRLDR
ncbi:MAG: FAD-binding oxidoreductase [Firmicutes bacterium]|nr:FAD-binding oxidoreductase [Bacillota bacterium]